MSDKPCLRCAIRAAIVEHYGADAVCVPEALAHLIAAQAELISSTCVAHRLQLYSETIDGLRVRLVEILQLQVLGEVPASGQVH